jgi:hypothetical protein
MQLIVLGMHRAGTSAVTRLINMFGAYFGPEGIGTPGTKDNPKGYWERKDILGFNRRIFSTRGLLWYRVDDWETRRQTALPDVAKAALQNAVLGLDAYRPWVLKDPRFCLTLVEWLPFLEVPVAVIVSRNPLEIARSLDIRDKLPRDYGLALWEYYTASALRTAAALPRVFVDYNDLVRAPVETVGRLYRDLVALGTRRLELPTDREILAFIEPALLRSTLDEGAPRLTDAQARLYAMQRGEHPIDPAIDVSDASRDLMRRMADAVAAIVPQEN